MTPTPFGHAVFTIHHRGVDYVKLEDYMALAKTIAEKADEPAPWRAKTEREWVDVFGQRRIGEGIEVVIRGVRAECAAMARERAKARFPIAEFPWDGLKRLADELERLP